jgi:hypothetical protein
VGNPRSPQFNGGDNVEGSNVDVIDDIFSSGTIGDLTLGQLSTILGHLNLLSVSNGNLSD